MEPLHHARRGSMGDGRRIGIDLGGTKIEIVVLGSEGEELLRAHAARNGMRPLRQDALRWVLAGVTSLEEAVRVTRES